jgi:carboxyl-terminal processing protease
LQRGRKLQLGLICGAVLIALSAAFGGAVSRRARAHTPTNSVQADTDADIERDFQEALTFVSDNYADDIDYEKANQAAIQGMLSTLDPHSTFFPPADFTRLKQDQDSQFYGIGVTILRHHDGVYVQSPVKDTPAGRAGLRYGDKIVEVDGKDARDWSSEQVSKAVRGDRGTAVTLKVERAGALAPLYYTMTRDTVPLPSIRTAFMLRPGTGYIALVGGFTHTTSDELEEALAQLDKGGMRQLVLDLRNNPGGLLDQAIEVASQFLPRGQVVVSVRGRGEYSQTKVYKNTDFDPADYPLVVLINRNTASASEIVAGALQDHGRGLLVGETSFGKGLVQRVFELRPWGAGLTLTNQKYYTPYGRSIQRDYSSGSLYDYYVRHSPEDEPAPAQPLAPTLPTRRDQNVSLVPTPQPTPAPSPTGPAVKTAGGRVFYGGGGITPDIEVKPLDITAPARARIFDAAFAFTRELAAGQIAGLESYRIDKVQYERDVRLADYPITASVVEAFQNFVRRHPELRLTAQQTESDTDYVRIRLREEIITAAFGAEAGARTLLDSDPQLLRALEAFPDAKRLAETIRNGGDVSLKLSSPASVGSWFGADWNFDDALLT